MMTTMTIAQKLISWADKMDVWTHDEQSHNGFDFPCGCKTYIAISKDGEVVAFDIEE